MKFSFAIFSLFFSFYAEAGSYKWSATLLTGLKNKTVNEAFCKDYRGYSSKSACADFKKITPLDFKFPAIQQESSEAIRIGGKKISVLVERTDQPTVFAINRKKINIQDYKSADELALAIEKLFPKLAWSLWVSLAYADASDDLNNSDLAKAVALFLKVATEEETCERAEKVADACEKESPPAMTSMAKALQMIGERAMTAQSNKTIFRLSDSEVYLLNDGSAKVNAELTVLKSYMDKAASRSQVLKDCSAANPKSKVAERVADCKRSYDVALTMLFKVAKPGENSQVVKNLDVTRSAFQDAIDEVRPTSQDATAAFPKAGFTLEGESVR